MSQKNNLVKIKKSEYLDKMSKELRENEERFIEEFGVSQQLEHGNPFGEEYISMPINWLNDEALMNLTEEEKETLAADELKNELEERGLQNNTPNTIEPEFDTSAYEQAKRSVLEKDTSQPKRELNQKSSFKMRPSN
jgi:hypothetical protein